MIYFVYNWINKKIKSIGWPLIVAVTPSSKFLVDFFKALYIGKLSLPADVIEISWLFLFMVELMAQNTSKSISKIFLSLVFHDIKLKLVSNCFFVSIKRYTKEKLSLIKE